MPRRKSLSDKGVAALKPRAARYAFPDPELAGHFVRIQPSGAKSFVAVARRPDGKQVWHTIGSTAHLEIEKAREKARQAIARIKEGLPPEEETVAPLTFGAVAERYLERHVATLRSKGEVERILRRYVLPKWKDRALTSIRRSDVADLLDAIQDRHGAAQADAALAVVQGLFNWRVARDDEFMSPIARGMRRTTPAARARSRILTDEEIRAIWTAGEGEAFGDFVRLLLLTAQRREKVAAMRWTDIDVETGEWTIPTEKREKGTAGALVLPEAALAIIRGRPQLEGCAYVFPAGRKRRRKGEPPNEFAKRDLGHMHSYSQQKAEFDRKTKVADWRLHDLRRTARSLMSRAGVRPEIAERVLGHVRPGVVGVYDRHSYREEKADALARLADLLASIINPPADNVLPMQKAVGS